MNKQDNNEMDKMDTLLNQTAENINPSSHFVAELEQSLAEAHTEKPTPGRFHFTYKQIFTTFAWAISLIAFALVMSWAIRFVVPSPTEAPAANNTLAPQPSGTPTRNLQNATTTPLPTDKSFDFRGAQLMVGTALPDAQPEANLYALLDVQPASPQFAQQLANQFGINGSIYTTQGLYGNTIAYMVTDGKQQLTVDSEYYYMYISDVTENARNSAGYKFNTAETTIREYLTAHGFNQNYQPVSDSQFSGYIWEQLSPDGLPMKYEAYYQPSINVTLNQQGGILRLTAMLIKYDPKPVAAYTIISPQEALKNLLDDTQLGGKIESGHSGPRANYTPPQEWYHDYPDNQPVTIYGTVNVSKAVEAGQLPAVFIDNVWATGNLTGMDQLENYAFIQASGQFVMENGSRKFNVNSWSKNVQQVNITGSAHRDGDRIIFTNEDGSNTQFTLVDPPEDMPMDTKTSESYLSITGASVGDQLYWAYIQFIADASQMGGGGGGGGLGFYQLNLSGTAVPFPTRVTGKQYSAAELAGFATYTVQAGDTLSSIAVKYNINLADLMTANTITDPSVIGVGWQIRLPGIPGPTRVDGTEGIVVAQIYQKPDGRERTIYTFAEKASGQYYELLGDNLDALLAVAKRPLKLWGTISHNNTGLSFITVEKFEELYPDLKFQVFEGTQKTMPVQDGQQLILLTANGVTYAQMEIGGAFPDSNRFDGSPDVYVEGLLIPNETYQGYPVLRVLNASPVVNPANGEKLTYNSMVGTLEKMPDPYGNSDSYAPPDIVIDKVELEYYALSGGTTTYLQPAWHFQGHNSNGDVLDFLIQALKPEYLSPELAPHEPPG